jgi:hypothetical protein
LPDLDVDALKAKVDTGARSSALHAFDLERDQRDGIPWVRFSLHPLQRRTRPTVRAEAPVIEERHVRSSSGRTEVRPVILTTVTLGTEAWQVELTLTRRDSMGFRMLLGRQAVRNRFLVDPGRSYLAGNPKDTP